MINNDVREYIREFSNNIVILENPSFDNSIIGISDDNKLVYNYDSMVEEFMLDNDVSMEEAIDFISYNTIRNIPYFNNSIIIVYPILDIK